MNVIFVNAPVQSEMTINPQFIDGVFRTWCVNSEMMKLSETFQEWFTRKKIELDYRIEEKGWPKDYVEALLFYDMAPVGGIVGEPNKSAMIIRYEWLKKEIKNG